MKTSILIFSFVISLSCFAQTKIYGKNSYFDDGKKLFDKKAYTDSKFYFEKDIVFNPKSENSYLYLAKIFKEIEKDDLEEENLKTVLLLNPKNEEALYLLTLLTIKRSNFSKAKELILTMTSVCKKMCSSTLELRENLDRSQKSQ